MDNRLIFATGSTVVNPSLLLDSPRNRTKPVGFFLLRIKEAYFPAPSVHNRLIFPIGTKVVFLKAGFLRRFFHAFSVIYTPELRLIASHLPFFFLFKN